MRKRFNAVLVLGLQLGPNDAPTPELIARADAAARAYERLTQEYGHELPLVACGGITPGHSAAEADVLAGLLIDRGVPEACITRERQSTTTMENMRFAARLLPAALGLLPGALLAPAARRAGHHVFIVPPVAPAPVTAIPGAIPIVLVVELVFSGEEVLIIDDHALFVKPDPMGTPAN